MTDTRIVTLRLQNPRLHIFCEAFQQKIIEGWKILVPARQGNTMYTITLSKEVPMDSELPAKAVWSCRLDFEPHVLEDVNVAQNEVQELVVAPYLPIDTLDLIPAPNTLSEEVAKSESGFLIKEYSLEEVQKLSWQQLSKLASDLGCATGNKVEREAAIVEQSKLQWSSK